LAASSVVHRSAAVEPTTHVSWTWMLFNASEVLALERLWLGRFPRKGRRQAQESRNRTPDVTTVGLLCGGKVTTISPRRMTTPERGCGSGGGADLSVFIEAPVFFGSAGFMSSNEAETAGNRMRQEERHRL
jgi:hypothetical protein